MSEQIRILDGRDFGIVIVEDELVYQYLPTIKAEGLALYVVLLTLAKSGDLNKTQAEIGAVIGWERKTVARWLKVLADAGLLEMQPQIDNGRIAATEYKIPHVPKRDMVQVQNHVPKKDNTTTNNGDEPATLGSLWLGLTGGYVNPTHVDLLYDYEQEFTYEWVADAIKETAASKTAMQLRGITPKYLLSIMERWRKEGRTTAQAEDESPDDYWARQGAKVIR